MLFLVVGASVLVALGGLWVVRRLVPLETLKRNNDVADPLYGAFSTLYAILVAFVVVIVFGEVEQASHNADHEALQVTDIFRLAGQYGGSDGPRIQELDRSYARVVIDEEWALMENGRASERAWDILDALERATGGLSPQTRREEILYDQLLTQTHELYANRNLRLLASKGALHPLLWYGLTIFGVATMAYTWFFGTGNVRAHAVLSASMAAVIAFVLFVIVVLDHPFSGDLRITPDAMELAVTRLDAAPTR